MNANDTKEKNKFLSEADYEITDIPRKNHLTNKSKSFTWEEAKKAILTR